MTLKRLSQLYYLKIEIIKDSKRLEELNAKATNATTNFNCRSGTGDSKTERYIPDIIKQKKIISKKINRCEKEKAKLEQYISDIPDSLTRMIFIERFINNKSWIQVAHSIGGGNTDESVKKKAYRYLNKK